MYDNILVPLDGSENSERSLVHAEALAKAFGATLHLVQVVSTSDELEMIQGGEEGTIRCWPWRRRRTRGFFERGSPRSFDGLRTILRRGSGRAGGVFSATVRWPFDGLRMSGVEVVDEITMNG